MSRGSEEGLAYGEVIATHTLQGDVYRRPATLKAGMAQAVQQVIQASSRSRRSKVECIRCRVELSVQSVEYSIYRV